jgi:Putative addiction module component
MPITLPLQTMSVEEKIQVMESIWDDLCDTAGSTLTPDWHGSILTARKAALKAGNDEVLDWETAKKKISQDMQ